MPAFFFFFFASWKCFSRSFCRWTCHTRSFEERKWQSKQWSSTIWTKLKRYLRDFIFVCLFVCLFVCYVYFCHLHVKWVINEPILPPSSRKKWLSRNLCAQIPTLRAAVTPMATTATQNNAAKRAKNKNTKTQKHKINAREYQEYRWNSASFRSLDGLLSLYVDSKTRSVFSEK